MKTLTIKRDMVESLDSDESKLDFVNSVIALLTDREPTTGMPGEIFQEGLNVDIPEPLEGSPEFDSSNMSAAQFKMFSMVRAGYFPVHLHRGYAYYTYKHRDDYSDDALLEMYSNISSKIRKSKSKKNFLVFLKYFDCVFWWYRKNVKRRDDNHC